MAREFNEATVTMKVKKDGTIDWIRVNGECCESTDAELVKSREAAHAKDADGNVIQPPSIAWVGTDTINALALAAKDAIEAAGGV